MESQQVEAEEDYIEKYTHKNGIWSTVQRLRRSQGPKPRFNHISFIYKNCLYVQGGTSIPIYQLDDQAQIIHRLTLESGKWDKIATSNTQKLQLQTLSSHCHIIHKNELIIFSGSNSKQQCTNKMYSLNLENFTWKTIDQKGQVPSARQSSCMIRINNQWVLIYGGLNFNLAQMYNDFYLYHIPKKTWHKAQSNHQYIIQSRSLCSLCYHKDRVYLFGGQYLTSNGASHFLNDFYQIEISFKTDKPKLLTNRIVTMISPAQRSGHNLILFGDKYLILLGGQNYYSRNDPNVNHDGKDTIFTRNDIWIFNTIQKRWLKMETSGQFFKYRTAFSTCVNQNKIYVFGGLKTYDHILDDTMVLEINQSKLEEWQVQKNIQPSIQCRLCYQQKNQMLLWPFTLEGQFLNNIINCIEFPFSAFGLLLDNALLIGATFSTIYFQDGKNGDKFIKIQDNGRSFPTVQLYPSIINFQMGVNFFAQGIDKRVKYFLAKQASKKQFGVNLKLGALRLGDSFLYISISQLDQVRVTLFCKQPIQNSNRYQYKCYFYVYQLHTERLLPNYSQQIRQAVQKKYLKQIKLATQKKNVKNTLYIMNLKKIKVYDQEQNQIYIDQLYTYTPNYDVFYGDKNTILRLNDIEISIFDCVDVSLRAYISLLFLKNQAMKIYLSINGFQKKQIPVQMFLEKIDKMTKNKQIMDLQGMIDHDCKIVQLYFNPDLKKKVHSFHNGILIYHKHRLITRYKYKFGDIISIILLDKYQKCFNFIDLFGYIELPEIVPINVFKTDFIYDVMLQKLYSRIKFISKFLQRKNPLTNFLRNNKRLHSQQYSKQQKIDNKQDKSYNIKKIKDIQINIVDPSSKQKNIDKYKSQQHGTIEISTIINPKIQIKNIGLHVSTQDYHQDKNILKPQELQINSNSQENK